MLEEYLCLGGNEVANNARTYGYATTADCPLHWFRCEPCETLHNSLNDWVPSESRWVELARNLATNPAAVTLDGWGHAAGTGGTADTVIQTGLVGFSRTTGVRTTWTVSPTSAGGTTYGNAQLPDIVPGTTYTISVDVQPSIAQTIQPSIQWRNSSGGALTVSSGDDFVFTAGQIRRISVTAVAPANAARATLNVWRAASGTAWPVGSTLTVTAVLAEASSGPNDYFDGATPDDEHDPVEHGDINYGWLGTANASASIRQQWTLVREGYSAELPYTHANIEAAPWYDQQKQDLTSRFYGTWLISVTGVDDSTRTATVTEGILDGGVVGLVRHNSREMVVTALLPANGDDALEYGLSWLDAALSAEGCSSHGGACGAVDMTFLASCPVAVDPDDIVWEADLLTRHLHNVTVTSGPLITDKLHSSDGKHVAYIVEWVMVAGTPFVFGQTREIPLEPSVPTVIQDVPYNLVPVPSAEISAGAVTVATNYITNPSFEANITDWSVGGDPPVSTSGGVVGSRTTDIHAAGDAALRARFTATAGGAGGTVYAMNTSPLPAGLGRRASVTLWMFAAVTSGTAVLGSRLAIIQWLTAADAVAGSFTLGPAAVTGGVLSAKSVAIPDTATKVRVIPYVIPTSWSTGAIIDLFVDAVAVTLP